MGEAPSSQVLFETEGLISDALQVISYKWLSRKFSVPSNIAKRLLERFVTQNPQLDLEIVYAVSGWTKTDPQCYSIQLAPKSKLEGAKAALRENPSVHVYSVQRCLPKDPAQMWSADFVQAVELFNEPQDVNNCLRDNRFSAVSCGDVERSLARKTSGSASSPQTSAPDSKPLTRLQPHPTRPPQTAPQPSLFPIYLGADTKPLKSDIPAVPPGQTHLVSKDTSDDMKPVKNETPSLPQASENNVSKGNALPPAAGKRKVAASVAPAGGSGGGSVSNLWGKAASKPKAPSPPKFFEPPAPVVHAGDAEARIQAMEADVYSEEDVEQYASSRVRRKTGSRRMIVDDDSGNEEPEEDEEMIVRLATPDSPQDVKPQLGIGLATSSISKKPEVSPKSPVPESKVSSNVLQDKNTIAGNLQHVKSVKKEEETVERSNGGVQEPTGVRVVSKRKKIMHTRIDEKGREVTEVAWMTEGEEKVLNDEKPQLVAAKASAPTNKEGDSKAPTERPRGFPKPQPAPPKAPSSKGGKTAGKAGGKQQGSIMSFFKKQ